MLTIAALTLRETFRRRLATTAAALSLVLVALTGWGADRLHAALAHHGRTSSLENGATFSGVTLLLSFMFSNMLAAGAAFLAAPAIASELDSGLLLAILPRPLRRAEFVLGKWLGLASALVAFALAVGAAELLVIDSVSGYLPPHPAAALVFICAESLVTLTLALFLSTRLPPISGAIAVVGLFGMAWIAGIVGSIARMLGNVALVHGATLVNLLMPTDGLWRGAAWSLEPVALALTAGSEGFSRSDPFTVGAPPPAAFLVWAALWVAGFLGATILSFRARDV